MIRPQTILPGVQAFPAETPTLPPATHTNSYALGTRDVLLVEPATPYEEERRQWLEWARSFESSGRRLAGLFLTHHHADHVGGAEFFARELDLPVWAHRATAARLSGVRITRMLEDGETLRLGGPAPQSWQVLHTPGHAPGHLCLYERELGHLVVGDMIASVGTILVAPHDGDMAEYLSQLNRLEALGARTALPAHGAPIEAPARTFAHYIHHRLERERKVATALRAAGERGSSEDDLVPVVYADTPSTAWPLAVLSLEAHLVKLVREGRAARDGSRYVSLDARGAG